MRKIIWAKRLLYLLLIIVPLHFSISAPYINDVKFLDLAVGIPIILFIYLFNRLRERSLYILKDKIDLSLYLYGIIVIIGIILSDNPIQSMRYYFLFFAFFSLFYIWRNLIQDENFPTIEKIAIWIVNIVSVYAMFQFYGYYLLFVPRNKEIISFFGNPNFAADFIAINMPFLIKRMLEKQLVGTILFGISYTALIMLGTRGALLGFFIGFILFFWWAKRAGQHIIKPLVIAILVMMVVSIIYSTPNVLNQRRLPIWRKLESTKEFLSGTENGGSIAQRIVFWKVTLLMIKTHPVKGVAPGRFGYFYPFYQGKLLEKQTGKKHAYNAKRAHNEYLQVFSETGIFGFLVFLYIIYLILVKGVGKIRKTGDLFYISITSGIIVFLVHSLVSFPLHLASSMLYFSLFVGLIVGEGREKIELRSKAGIIALYFILIIMVSFLFGYTIKAYIARMYLGKGKITLLRSTRADDPIPMVKEGFRKVVIANYLDPYDPLSTFYLGKVYQFLRKYDKAIGYYKKFLRMYSDFNAMFNMAMCYYDKGDIEDAIISLERLRSLKPDDPHLYLYLGIAYMKEKKYDKAISILKEGLTYNEEDKKKVPLYINLAISYRKLGKLEEAIKYLEMGKKIEPDNKRINDMLNTVDEKSGLLFQGFEVIGKNREDVDKVKRVLGDIAKDIKDRFSLYPVAPFRVIITNTSAEFEKKLGISGFYGGATVDNTIYLKPISLIEKYSPLRDILLHEYVHILVNEMGEDKPLWVQEGFAVYLSGEKDNVKPDRFKFLPISGFPHKGYSKNIYYNAYLKVSGLIDTYGIERFVSFLKDVDYYNERELFKKVFGLSEEDFDSKIEENLGGING